MDDLISRQAAIDALAKAMPSLTTPDGSGAFDHDIQIADEAFVDAMQIIQELPSAQPEIIQCHQCGFWDRDTLQHNSNDFRDWNEAECLVLAERDGYHEINRYTEADDFCSRAERRIDE